MNPLDEFAQSLKTTVPQWVRDELHRGDDLIDITPIGATEPKYVTGYTAAQRILSRATAEYVGGRITLLEFELIVEEVYGGY